MRTHAVRVEQLLITIRSQNEVTKTLVVACGELMERPHLEGDIDELIEAERTVTAPEVGRHAGVLVEGLHRAAGQRVASLHLATIVPHAERERSLAGRGHVARNLEDEIRVLLLGLIIARIADVCARGDVVETIILVTQRKELSERSTTRAVECMLEIWETHAVVGDRIEVNVIAKVSIAARLTAVACACF